MSYLEILKCCCQGQKHTREELEKLALEELSQGDRAKAFRIDRINCQQMLEERLQLLPEVHPKVDRLCRDCGFKDSDYILNTLWNLWLPLAIQIACQRKKLNRTLIQGVLGGQGTGKTTLADVIQLLLKHLGYSSVAISIDDLYKTYDERKRLQQQDPRLIWRGPPGTHDVALGIEVLDKLRNCDPEESISIPRFDKSVHNGAGDRCESEKVKNIDIVLFEGWFVGAYPVAESMFENAPPPIATQEDKLFAIDTNRRLKEYLPLWEKLDRLLVLYPVDYRLSKQWRKQAEHKMIAKGKSGMNDDEIDRFVEYFWRSLHPELFITPLTKNSELVNMVININADHTPGEVYQPSN
jgi:D-glycerate 3-kinase